MVYNSVTGKTAAVPPKAKAKPKKAKQVQVQALKPLGKAPSSSKEDKVKASKDTPKDKAVPAAAKAEAARPAGKPRIITTIEHKGKKLEILDEPVPAGCNAIDHADFDGYAVQWGLGNKARSAAECCKMCQDFASNNPTAPHPCNAWVWCGDPSGTCWTMDIHAHTTGDCWLKFQKEWDNNPDLKTSNIKVNHLGKFSDTFRKEHKTAPDLVPWTAGLIPAKTKSKSK